MCFGQGLHPTGSLEKQPPAAQGIRPQRLPPKVQVKEAGPPEIKAPPANPITAHPPRGKPKGDKA